MVRFLVKERTESELVTFLKALYDKMEEDFQDVYQRQKAMKEAKKKAEQEAMKNAKQDAIAMKQSKQDGGI